MEAICAVPLNFMNLPALPKLLALLALLEASERRSADARARALELDSALRWAIVNGTGENFTFPFQNLILARVWERLGEPARALAAVRLRELHQMWFWACIEREEGRLAALLGDTATAIRSYRRYLRFRRDADPIFIPQRDSVVAELARLERR